MWEQDRLCKLSNPMKQIQLAPYGERNTKLKQRASCLCDLARHPCNIPTCKIFQAGGDRAVETKGQDGAESTTLS